MPPVRPQAIYINRSTDAVASVSISDTPTTKPVIWTAGPGETVEGPALYHAYFSRFGLELATAEEIAAASAPKSAPPAAPDSPAPAGAPDDSDAPGVIPPSRTTFGGGKKGR